MADLGGRTVGGFPFLLLSGFSAGGLLAKCRSRCVRELQMAPINWMPHPYTVCRAYPWMAVSMTIFITRMTIKIPITPAVADPKLMNPCQILADVLSTILFRESSSSRLYMGIPPGCISCPVSRRANSFNRAGFSAGNMMWSLSFSMSSLEYIPLIASDPGLMYPQDSFVMGWSCCGGICRVCGFGVNCIHVSSILYRTGTSAEHSRSFPNLVSIRDLGVRNSDAFLTVTGSSLKHS